MTKKTLLLLKGVFHTNVEHKYKMSSSSVNNTPIDNIRTNISELNPIKTDNEQSSFSFLDEAKKDHMFVVSMYNEIGKLLPKTTNIHCFWCRHTFSTHPIGCPISYLPHRIIKKINSDTSKDTCILRENISIDTFEKIRTSLTHIPIVEQDIYLVDGIFCSFPCCMAFIQDNQHKNPLYTESECLLRQMYQKIFDSIDYSIPIMTAPSWRLLQEYGGHLSISDFRKGFDNTHYIDTNQIVNEIPNQKHIGFIYEKQITL